MSWPAWRKAILEPSTGRRPMIISTGWSQMMIATTLVASFLWPCHASFAAATLLRRAKDPESLQLNPAPLTSLLVGRATSAAPGRLARVQNLSTVRRLDEDLKQCLSVNFTTHIITTKANSALSVAAADLDGDGDIDVLSASSGDNKIAWYENLNGVGDFSGPQRVITTQADGAYSVLTADLDGDSDLDVLSASSDDNKIAWYENLDGAGDFSGPQRNITTQASWAYSVAAGDIDGDSDLDVLSASSDDDKIAWYENLDGAGDFSGPQRVITILAVTAKSVAAADLDGDGDLDVLSGSSGSDKIAWYVNFDGTGDFSQRVITNQANGASSVAAADLDGDGDLDVLSASGHDNKIAWYENLDGAGDFSGPQLVITTQASGADSVVAADIDKDGDLDVLSASSDDNKVAWYENLDGAGEFSGPQRVITTQAVSARSVAAADLDGDGDLDVLSASNFDSKIAWYENECEPMTPHPTPEPTTLHPTLEPTPEPTPEPTYWGAQVFGKQPQTAGFERLCVAWCVIFGVASVVVLGYIVYASPHKDKKLARVILTIVLSQYDYASDTLFIGFQNFVTPTLFIAALIAYLLPLVVFVVVYRRVVSVHVARIYTSNKAKIIVHFDSWDELPKAFIEVGSCALFTFAFAASTFAYLIVLFVIISCKLTSVSFVAVKIFECGAIECTQEAFEVMFKRNILSELVFESSGMLIIVLVDTSLRAQQDFRSNTCLSSWAVLSIVGSILMLVIEVWPYLYHIVWMGLGIEAGIAAASTKLKFTPEEVLGTWLIDRLVCLPGHFASRVQTVTGKLANGRYRYNSEIHNVKTFDLAEQRDQ